MFDRSEEVILTASSFKEARFVAFHVESRRDPLGYREIACEELGGNHPAARLISLSEVWHSIEL